MLTLLVVIFLLWLFFNITGFAFRIAGKILGFFLSLIGYVILGILAISVLGFTVYVLPVFLLIGIGALVIGLRR